MTTQVDLNWSYVCTCAPPDTEKREERTAARGTSGRYESSPCSIERHVGVDRARDLDLRGPGDAPPDAEERDEEGPLLSTTTNSKPAEMPTTTAGTKSARPRGREAVEHWSP